MTISMAISKFSGNNNQNTFLIVILTFEITIGFYLSVTHPSEALETERIYLSKTPCLI